MARNWHIRLLSALMLSSTALTANAQSIYVSPHHNFFGNDRRFDLRDDFRFGHHRFDRMTGMREMQFNTRVADVRRQISIRVAQGRLPSMRAARLNDRVNDIIARKDRLKMAGMLTGDELSMLEARLSNVEVAARTGGSWY